MSIAATRMYRGLDEFLSSDMYEKFSSFLYCAQGVKKRICSSHAPPRNGGRTTISISRAWGTGTTAVPTPLDGIKVDVHTSHDHSLASPAIQYGLDSNMDKQLHDKPRELV